MQSFEQHHRYLCVGTVDSEEHSLYQVLSTSPFLSPLFFFLFSPFLLSRFINILTIFLLSNGNGECHSPSIPLTLFHLLESPFFLR